MLPPTMLTVIDEHGRIKDEVKLILDLIAGQDAILSAGHLHISEIWPLFTEARQRGITRLLVNHPTFLIGCSASDMAELAKMGALLEHSCCMWAGVQGAKYTPESLRAAVEGGGVASTIIGSDLGQVGNTSPVDVFRHVIGMLIGLGYSDADIRTMIADNPAKLLGLDD